MSHIVGVIMGVILVIAPPTGSCFGCQSLIKRLIWPKFGVWSPSNWESIIDITGCGFSITTPTGSHFANKN